MGDVDGIVEINGNALMLEWKTHQGLPTGQKIMYERLSRGGQVTVFIIHGNAETMQCRSYGIYYRGKFSGMREATLESIKDRMRKWNNYAENNPWKY